MLDPVDNMAIYKGLSLRPYFLFILFKYSGHTILYYFQMCNIVIQQLYISWREHRGKSSKQLTACHCIKCIVILTVSLRDTFHLVPGSSCLLFPFTFVTSPLFLLWQSSVCVSYLWVCLCFVLLCMFIVRFHI